ncbi:MAG: hypothetical protein A2X61_14755 [Ignavibacteria bacterium GWB2_35_12]|nr:MAG: hypothetical protein A2X61_14755 [Ignavibacteria bacterium GWB2_35_12]OGU94211.1 MAG: hypothetical protein A2220_01760 [Ignavibacteria bacterium RIFOXYA2_FULL_35_10]OGV23423.1 MAG: hypothetical protein A2475_06500 [Ignavibacteria bacterium RIFOXYC2_FULL_35_21]
MNYPFYFIIIILYYSLLFFIFVEYCLLLFSFVMEKYLTPEQVAERLMVEKTTVYTWLRQHKIKGIKFGKFWRVPEKELEKTTNSQKDDENKKLDFSKWITFDFKVRDENERYDREFLYSDTDRGT